MTQQSSPQVYATAQRMFSTLRDHNRCPLRSCEAPDLKNKNLRKCVISPSCVVSGALDYATEAVLERETERTSVAEGTSTVLSDNAQAIRSKLASRAAQSCGYDLSSKTDSPVPIYSDASGTVDIEHAPIGDAATDCMVKSIAETIVNEHSKAQNQKYIDMLVLAALASAAIYYFTSR